MNKFFVNYIRHKKRKEIYHDYKNQVDKNVKEN